MTNEVEKLFIFYCPFAYPFFCKTIHIIFTILLSAWQEMVFLLVFLKLFIYLLFFTNL